MTLFGASASAAICEAIENECLLDDGCRLIMSSDYAIDVAFSFLQHDEQLAKEIADRFRDRTKVFIYSEQADLWLERLFAHGIPKES